MSQITQPLFDEALAGVAAAALVSLFAISFLPRTIRQTRSQFSAANLATLLLTLGLLCFGLGFFSNSLAFAWLLALARNSPYELIPPPYNTVLDWGTRAGEGGAILFGGIGGALWLYAWLRRTVRNRHTTER